jgi:hypothetical protein
MYAAAVGRQVTRGVSLATQWRKAKDHGISRGDRHHNPLILAKAGTQTGLRCSAALPESECAPRAQ